MQLQTGALSCLVTDPDGDPLPGVTVDAQLSGDPPQVRTTNATGYAIFETLMPGTYEVKAELAGYSDGWYPDVRVAMGRKTDLPITLQPAVGGGA